MVHLCRIEKQQTQPSPAQLSGLTHPAGWMHGGMHGTGGRTPKKPDSQITASQESTQHGGTQESTHRPPPPLPPQLLLPLPPTPATHHTTTAAGQGAAHPYLRGRRCDKDHDCRCALYYSSASAKGPGHPGRADQMTLYPARGIRGYIVGERRRRRGEEGRVRTVHLVRTSTSGG
jgi:hypothetical protein